jgi:hypothetical protein
MGTIVVYKDPDSQDNDPRIDECHVNLWVLPALMGTRYLLDLGFYLENRGTSGSLQKLRLVVPMADPEPYCLVSRMEAKPQSWDVIFSPTSRVIANRAVRKAVTLEKQEELSKKLEKHSVWRLTLSPTSLQPHETGYVRTRFGSYTRPACLERIRVSGGLSSEDRLDLRLYDWREIAELQEVATHFRDLVVPVEKSFVYVVAPRVRTVDLCSPSLAYIRVLEDRLWRLYLGRRLSFCRSARKMLVFSWKRTDGTNSGPHRIFATLVPGSSRRRALSTLRFALTVIVLLAGGALAWQQAVRIYGGSPWNLLILVLAFVLLFLPVLIKRISIWNSYIESAYSRLDEWMYGVRY